MRAAAAFLFLVACSSADGWSVRWVERIDDDRVAVVWREGCGDPTQDRGRIDALRLADGAVTGSTGGAGAVHVIAKTPGTLWYYANGTYAVDLPDMVRHRVESNLSAHPQIGASSPSGPRVRGVAGDMLVLPGTDGNEYLASANGDIVRREQQPIRSVPDLRTDLVDDLRRPGEGDKRDRVFYVVEAGRPVSAGSDRWLIVSGRERHNLHAVGDAGVAWSRAVADLVGAPPEAKTRLLWASDEDGLHVVVGYESSEGETCRFGNALVRLNPQSGATLSTHSLNPSET